MRAVVLLVLVGFSLLAKTITVGILTDAPTSDAAELRTLFIDEITRVTEGEFRLRFPETKRLMADFSPEMIDASIDRLMNDPEVDVVLLLGEISGQLALKRSSFRKPVFAPLVFNPSLSGLKKGSTVRNLNYVTGHSLLEEEIGKFRTIVPFARLAILVDGSLYRLFGPAARTLAATAASDGIEVAFVPVSGDDKQIFPLIPAGTEAVLLTPLHRTPPEALEQLMAELKTRAIPTYALEERALRMGALAASLREDDPQRKARRCALNVLSVLRGGAPHNQPTTAEEKRRLVLNMATARAIGFSPPFSLLDEAVVIHEHDEKSPPLTLESVTSEAVRANLGIIAAQLGVEAEGQNVAEVRSLLYPSISAELGYSQMNSDHVFVRNGFYAEKSATGTVKLQQLLFSERALANLQIQQQLHVVAAEQHKALETEVAYQAAATWLRLLSSHTHRRISQEHLELTRTNLSLARNRMETGLTDMSDLHYWESAIASAQQRVLDAAAEVEKSADRLNLILNRPLDDRFATLPPTLDEPGWAQTRDRLMGLLVNPGALEKVTGFFVQEGVSNHPLLRALSASVAAQKRRFLSDERSYWSPRIAAGAELSRVFDETRAPGSQISLEDQTQWQAGVTLELPLYEGGGRSARISRSDLELRRTQIRFEEEKEKLTQQIRSDLFALRASYPSIELTRKAARSARESFLLVRANYAQGTRSMGDLLAASNASLESDRAAADAFYRFLGDVMALQRDIGGRDLFLDPPSREELVKRLASHLSFASKETP